MGGTREVASGHLPPWVAHCIIYFLYYSKYYSSNYIQGGLVVCPHHGWSVSCIHLPSLLVSVIQPSTKHCWIQQHFQYNFVGALVQLVWSCTHVVNCVVPNEDPPSKNPGSILPNPALHYIFKLMSLII